MSLRIVPVSLDQANDYVDRLHRHSDPLPGCRYAIGVEDDSGELHGVAIIGNPSSPALQKVPRLIEIRRVCTDGARNACSMLDLLRLPNLGPKSATEIAEVLGLLMPAPQPTTPP